MNILLATHHLERTGGTEAFTFAVATSLRRQGYDVEYYCFKRGGVSDRIEAMGIPFMSRKRYDLVLLNHKPIADNLCGKGVLLQTCHGVIPEIEQPSRYADIWVSVSDEVKTHVESLGFPTTTIWNGIDCERFRPVNALHDRLTTVLSLCQSERAHAMVKSCCERLNVEFLRADKLLDDVWEIESMMNKADLVVGIGRSLYDAMACGRAVVSFDMRDYNGQTSGYGYLSSDNVNEAMVDNCVNRHTRTPLDAESLLREISKYKKEDGEFFRQFALRNLNVDVQLRRYIQLYAEYLAKEKDTPLLDKLKRGIQKKLHQLYEWQKYFFRGKARQRFTAR
ncbi:MAG: glycosyltransferase family 4 protein [Paludibacteraceae bacterium]|nr:glycosyltransferase family 4 protein [Paludibacteraceae bacterium]